MRNFLSGLALLALVLASTLQAQETLYHHDLDIKIDPIKHTIEVRDSITIPDGVDLKTLRFSLHEGLSPSSPTAGVSIIEIPEASANVDKGMDQEDHSSVFKTTTYQIHIEGQQPDTLVIEYAGIIHHPVKQMNEEYSRGFSQSPGLIDEQGVFLSESTHWVPSFGDEYITYKLKVQVPAGWRTVSQGTRTAQSENDKYHHDTWEVNTPTEEVFVISAQFTEYEYQAGNVTAMAFLRDKDDALANKYLETTAQYLEMYRELVGVYPYAKFALVENFWETGYGMPSFTLLGPQIIRFPFILHSSYPHELLHNWWGNGVFVDFESGNWCEGLTAYMADHLIAEQRGNGAASRLSTLQSYTDYVSPEDSSLVVVTRHPADTNLAIAWLSAHDIEAVAGLARKLPHYGKYSYLGFTGTEPTNSLKGQWPAVGSPLSADLVDQPGELPVLKKRPALAMLAPVFNAARMQLDVETLAADDMQGRVPGSTGLDKAADYIA
ncbi:MAG: hypothetical protein L3J24_14525, partial [Xanthomonadales bacterium]|nr:hypothetical protein [Xanthomonadales bacterium]